MSHYDTLGIDKDADEQTVKKAYRKKAMETHPDVNNGEDDEFKKVSLAYRVLSDPDDRAYYDRNGSERKKNDPEIAAIQFIVSAFKRIVAEQGSHVFKCDIFSKIATLGLLQIDEIHKFVKGKGGEVNRLKAVLERLESPYCESALKGDIADAEYSIQEAENDLKVFELVPELCKDQCFVFDNEKETQPPMGGGFGRSQMEEILSRSQGRWV